MPRLDSYLAPAAPSWDKRWVWLPVWLCAAARRPQLCLSVGPSGKRAHPGSGGAHTARHTPGSCQHPEPAITHTMLGVCTCVCLPVYFTLEKTDISAVSLLSDARRQCKMNGGGQQFFAPLNHPFYVTHATANTGASFCSTGSKDNERNLLAV